MYLPGKTPSAPSVTSTLLTALLTITSCNGDGGSQEPVINIGFIHSGHWGPIQPRLSLVYSLDRSNFTHIFQTSKPPEIWKYSTLDYECKISADFPTS